MNKRATILITILGSFALGSSAMAECPNHLSVDEMVDCIVVEGSGDIHPKSEFKKSEPVEKENLSKTENSKNAEQLSQAAK
jgi:hypothetical protein